MGIRELLQNAHDSCSRRQIESKDESYTPRVDVRIGDAKILEIEDNGSGLTEEEITEYLTTIGSGYTRTLREMGALDRDSEVEKLIGQFGLGFLSAFLVAEYVEMETLSSQTGARPIHWESSGDGAYAMDEGSKSSPGTRIRLKCRSSMEHLLELDSLARLVHRYCDLLPHPIFIQDNPAPANRTEAPWESVDFKRNMLEFLEAHEIPEPLWMIPLQDWRLEFNGESLTVPLRGCVFIPQRSIASLQEFGTTNVYIRGMFICENQKTLLPRWARFVRAFVSSSMLQPTASRESLHEDDNFELVSLALEKQLLAALDDLSLNQRELWSKIIRSHTDLIIGWATSDDRFFTRLVNRIELDTSHGRQTIFECLTAESAVHYRTNKIMSPIEQILSESLRHPVIDGSWFGVLPLLRRFHELNPNVRLIDCDNIVESSVRRTDGKHFEKLLGDFNRLDVPQRFVTAEFDPADLAIVFSRPKNADVISDAKAAIDNKELIPGIADLIPSWVRQQEQTVDDLEGTFFINTRSPVIQRLNRLAGERELDLLPLQLLADATQLLCVKRLSANEGKQTLRRFNQAVGQLLR
ncbi:MAG: ATP-binding protein [Planctomycetaceae bacterium]|nr:ATP-binding protein [Planctomycetaceae bacterium]